MGLEKYMIPAMLAVSAGTEAFAQDQDVKTQNATEINADLEIRQKIDDINLALEQGKINRELADIYIKALEGKYRVYHNAESPVVHTGGDLMDFDRMGFHIIDLLGEDHMRRTWLIPVHATDHKFGDWNYVITGKGNEMVLIPEKVTIAKVVNPDGSLEVHVEIVCAHSKIIRQVFKDETWVSSYLETVQETNE